MVKGAESMWHEKWKYLAERNRPKRHKIAVFKYLLDYKMEKEYHLYIMAPKSGTKPSGQKQQEYHFFFLIQKSKWAVSSLYQDCSPTPIIL